MMNNKLFYIETEPIFIVGCYKIIANIQVG